MYPYDRDLFSPFTDRIALIHEQGGANRGLSYSARVLICPFTHLYSRALIERVSDHAEAFVAEGLPPDLVKQLGDDIAAFAAARDAQTVARQRFSSATELIRDTLDHAANAVDVLQAIAINTPGAPPELAAKVRSARRIGPRVTAPPKTPQSTPTNKAA